MYEVGNYVEPSEEQPNRIPAISWNPTPGRSNQQSVFTCTRSVHLMARRKYNYGKIFKKNGKWWRYRYEGRKKSTKTLTRYTRKRNR